MTQSIPTNEQRAWVELSAADYDSAVYSNPLLLPVLRRELEIARDLVRSTDILIEVGCGTGQFCRRLADRVNHVVGIDISSSMLGELAKHATPNMVLVEGDATALNAALMQAEGSSAVLDRAGRRVLACVMNTLGIMEVVTRRSVVKEMAGVAGHEGIVFLAVFSAKYFAVGVRDFYATNPELCGILDASSVDLDSSELRVRGTGYFSHWFTEAELIELAARAGLANVEVEATGVGLFLRANGSATAV